jgi:predicted glycosyltransferase
MRVLVRPPAEESHYYRSESLKLAVALLRYLAEAEVEVIFAPRYARQIDYLEAISWRKDPIVLEKPIPFAALLKAVDAVVSAGGTMTREAAFLGIPSYSVFRSRIGAVDEYLAATGRLALLSSPGDFARVQLTKRSSLSPLRRDPSIIERAVETILERASRGHGDLPTSQ